MSTDTKIISGVGIFMLVIIGGVWILSEKDVKNQGRLDKPLMGEEIPSQGAQHVARTGSHPEYNSNPPVSGWHWGDGVAGPGIKNQQVPDELVLHSMEHGAAVLWYKDDLTQVDVERLKEVFREATGKKIMIPRKNLDVPVALTSWGRLLKLQTIDEAKIKEFIETNNDRAPEKAPI